MKAAERDVLLTRLDERTKQTHAAVKEIKADAAILFGQTRDHESRISNIEGSTKSSKGFKLKLFGSSSLVGVGYGLSELIKRIMNNPS